MSMRGLEIAREIMAQPALKPFIKAEALPGKSVTDAKELFDYACRMAKTDHHPVGTCAMGSGPDAVVSPDLKVRGIEGLRICDASVMPFVPSANTNAATIMVAERGSQMIRSRV
jgi:choline dehydrogenase-like flavoprotein